VNSELRFMTETAKKVTDALNLGKGGDIAKY